jgi:hypothetical protein
MSVRPTSFDDPTAWEYIHDDAPGGSHGGTLDPSTVTYGTNTDRTPNQDVVLVLCPECGAVSAWPPGGGADALMGQSLHVMVGLTQPATRGSKSADQVVADVKQRVIDTDGEQRWVLDDAALAVLEAAAHK